MKKLTLLLLLATLSVSAAPPTTVILVRHAEKTAGDPSMKDDPPLSAEGEARAQKLARMLASSGITAIYTTPFARTRDTAAPLAAALKLTPVAMKTGPTYAAEMAAKAREHAGETVLVVGHSNSTQNVMKALGLANAPKIEESEYDNLFIVTLGEEPTMLVLKY